MSKHRATTQPIAWRHWYTYTRHRSYAIARRIRNTITNAKRNNKTQN